MMTRKKIGIFGGTFDPVHYAHLILAREAREELGLEQLIFVPAAASPHKGSPAASAELRLSMLRAAIEGETAFAVDESELRRGPPSYTIDTVEEIQQREAGSEIFYLIGEDNVTALASWHCFERLQKMVRFIVLDRTGAQANHPYEVIHRKIDISATDIRNRIASGRSIHYLVPPKVEETIRRNNLYREPVK
ncbi:MAG: nicotinate (nicotinamide) nucleotide adenylyltransferase [Verrucomicrobia bacterium]|nr:MAG: nicotinate (nicotinamide) nucleotide adenylyltransferase [Verrucomicrobiota bacterium]PYK94631.1 MAG: nicotinate (nicotinamide) nucleotide adenylyltransferase [Verrucomicrobiota bacterium]PYL40855.1 MAG: nicotinate (nicotinamide) nucleotide adenylyltransferase [Verrucomicrobiota bacterium]PYL58286.1 MAG: nicotinate (nicotinamide) nucleotide adenylyltransferase [Verrucomicrobiota bacterium]